jgi:hypothetical protein
MVNTIKFSQFLPINYSNTTNEIVGVTSPSGGSNFKGPYTANWTTATRPASPNLGTLGFNSTLGQYEFWDGTAWIQLAAGGSGSVNPGNINEMAWYAATGNTVSGLVTIPNGVLITDPTVGIPSISTTLPLVVQNNISSLLGLTGYLKAPLGVKDVNGNISVTFGSVPFAVNYVGFSNNISGFSPSIHAFGADANVTLQLGGKGTGGAAIEGTKTNDNAIPGFVGEYISSSVLQGAAVPLTNLTVTPITNITLTPGDWDVSASVYFHPQSTTSSVFQVGGISRSNSSFDTPASNNNSAAFSVIPGSTILSLGMTLSIGTYRALLLSATNIYLLAQAGFTGGALDAYGYIAARRMR